MKLKNLSLRNFKGIQKFDLSLPDGQDAAILGDNGTGKTTVADAYYWLLTDKDSLGNATFDIKTIEKSGESVHGVEHTVHGVFDLGGKHLELTKVFQEVWTKKRGKAKAKFIGHKTEHFINGVPVKKTEYAAKMKAIADPETFKLLTSPVYFPEILHWEKRRGIVLQVCGDIPDNEIIAYDDALYGLPAILGDNSHDEHKKIVKAAQAKINKELAKISTRVDENISKINIHQEAHPLSSRTIEEDLGNNLAALSSLQKKRVRLAEGGQTAELKKDLALVEQKIIKIENLHLTSVAEQTKNFRAGATKADTKTESFCMGKASLSGQISTFENQIFDNENEMVALRVKWDEIRDRMFEESGDCPTCGQPLPNAYIHRAMEQFNVNKSDDLTKISRKGKKLSEENKSLRKNIDESKKKIDVINKDIEEQRILSQTARDEINKIEATLPKYGDLENKKVSLNDSIRELSKGEGAEELTKTDAEIEKLEKTIDQLKTEKKSIENLVDLRARICELEGQQKKLATEYERLESELFLLEQFVRTKAGLLEGKIKSVFASVRFRMFREQINGGFEPCCDVLGPDGVPYSFGLNSGARTNIGLRCINVLGKYYKQSFPVFCDNSESVTELEKIDAQMIKFVVSKEDKTLRIEGE